MGVVLVQGIIAGFIAGVIVLAHNTVSPVRAEAALPLYDTPPQLETRPAPVSLARGRCPQGSEEESDLSLLHITQTHGLPEGYMPIGLVEVPPPVRMFEVVCLTPEAALALHELYVAARSRGIRLEAYSGYRSSSEQAGIRSRRYAADGPLALRAVAPPNYSEHQTGTAIDLTGRSVGYEKAKNGFEDTPEYAWLSDNAWRYGLTLSYPKTLKNGDPGPYRFEPWHWRYVGVAIAERLQQLDISYNELPENMALSTP